MPDGAVVYARLYTKNLLTMQQEVLADGIDTNTYTVSFDGKPYGFYLLGVTAYIYVQVPDTLDSVELESVIVWSNDSDVVAVPVPFGISYWSPMGGPTGFAPVSQ